MNLFSRVKRWVVFALPLALLLFGAFLPSGRVSSKPVYLYSYEFTFYSDASHTQIVGVRDTKCNGTSTLSGTSSPYYTQEVLDICCGSVPC